MVVNDTVPDSSISAVVYSCAYSSYYKLSLPESTKVQQVGFTDALPTSWLVLNFPCYGVHAAHYVWLRVMNDHTYFDHTSSRKIETETGEWKLEDGKWKLEMELKDGNWNGHRRKLHTVSGFPRELIMRARCPAHFATRNKRWSKYYVLHRHTWAPS